MKALIRGSLVVGAAIAAQATYASTARADLLTLQRWSTHDGGWIDRSQWLVGDFDGNGRTDIAYVFAGCGSGCDLNVGIDVHASCSPENSRNPGATCPAGIPNGNQAGAFVLQHWWNFGPTFNLSVNNLGCGDLFSGCTTSANGTQWIAGDFNGDGMTDIVNISNSCIDCDGSILFQPFISGGNQFQATNFSAGLGWVEASWAVAGDFDGDGTDELAYVFDDNGGISVDVYRYNVNEEAFDGPERWVTQQGAWVGGSFVVGDFNGDNSKDIALAWGDQGQINLDAHLSCQTGFTPPQGCPGQANTFALQRWATHEGSWVTPEAWMGAPGAGGIQGTAFSMVSNDYSNGFWHPLAGNGDLIFAFSDNGNISIDGHLASRSPGFGTDGFFDIVRYATQQGQYPSTVAFLAGDFNGDTVGDVADAFADSGQIDIDVHLGNCLGGVTSDGQCCSYPQQACFGACYANSQACENSVPPPPR